MSRLKRVWVFGRHSDIRNTFENPIRVLRKPSMVSRRSPIFVCRFSMARMAARSTRDDGSCFHPSFSKLIGTIPELASDTSLALLTAACRCSCRPQTHRESEQAFTPEYKLPSHGIYKIAFCMTGFDSCPILDRILMR